MNILCHDSTVKCRQKDGQSQKINGIELNANQYAKGWAVNLHSDILSGYKGTDDNTTMEQEVSSEGNTRNAIEHKITRL